MRTVLCVRQRARRVHEHAPGPHPPRLRPQDRPLHLRHRAPVRLLQLPAQVRAAAPRAGAGAGRVDQHAVELQAGRGSVCV